MTWTNALGLCPRCDGPVEKGQLLCSQCGLDLVVPPYLHKKDPPELNTSVIQPMDLPHKAESKLPAILVMCAVLVLAAGMVLSGFSRNDNTAQATPYSTPTPTRELSLPTSPPRSLSQAGRSTRTPTPQPPPPTATPQPTYTPLPPPPPTATTAAESQSAKLLPGVGGYTSDFNGWWMKLDGTGARRALWSPSPDTMHAPQGTFWLAYVVYRNDSNTSRSLGATVDFSLKGSDSQAYPEYSDRGRDPQRKKIALAMKANSLDFTVAPGQRTATVLVFDLPPGIEPAQLVAGVLDGDSISSAEQVAWDLSKTP